MPSKPENPELIRTGDGSDTLYSHRFDQHYHNPKGAVAESKHNFFETNGVYQSIEQQDRITVLEVGFGTGLNLMLLLDAWLSADSKPKVKFVSIEAFPIDEQTARSSNYQKFMRHAESTRKVIDMFTGLQPGINQFTLYPDFNAIIFCGFFEEFQTQNLQADYIFHDPFSPEVNEKLWTVDTFIKLKEYSSDSVILTTYSAASSAKAAMAVAGWKVAKASGALGKREMTVATLDENKLSDFKRVNEKRLIERYEAGDFE